MSNLKDFGTSTVLTAPSPADSGTSLVVEAGHGNRFPAAPFYIVAHPPSEFPTLDNAEKILVTAKSTDTFTLDRAEGDTTAKNIEAGWRVSNTLFLGDLAATFDDLTDGSTNKAFTNTLKTKLDGIETAADVTDATNVAAAGAVMESDTSTASMSFVVDEDDMASNSATKLPTQQSVKAYVDNRNTSRWFGYRTSNQTTTSTTPQILATQGEMSGNVSVSHTTKTGKVRVFVTLPCQNSANNAQVYVYTNGSQTVRLLNYAGGLYYRSGEAFITGLTPGDTYTFDVRAGIDGGATFTFPAYSTLTFTVQDY